MKYTKGAKGLYDYDIKALNELGYITPLLDGGHSIISNSTSKPFLIPKILRYIPIQSWNEDDKIWLNT